MLRVPLVSTFPPVSATRTTTFVGWPVTRITSGTVAVGDVDAALLLAGVRAPLSEGEAAVDGPEFSGSPEIALTRAMPPTTRRAKAATTAKAAISMRARPLGSDR
ncbi:hypothetical protein LUW76_24710 [Actinomadura madurae]|uniref:hypothetical protein n=1 Tax=Actinomadura madurae TaxID=1993 RepID=UPI0020267986|nr:hypothetical protein [Actinomadura madurae]URM97295.1 hypothetical protein LUW76_24710 [Actinomadura madurae]